MPAGIIRLLQPERPEEILASILDLRQKHAERRCEHIAELNTRATEADLHPKRLHDAIEAGVAELHDPALKEPIVSIRTIRGQAQADAARAVIMLETSGQHAITPQMVQKFARTARDRIRIDGGGYRRDHLRALAQRMEAADREVHIVGSNNGLLRTLTAAGGVEAVWLRSQFGSKLAERVGFEPTVPRRYNGFRDRPDRPLRHLSSIGPRRRAL